MLPIDRGHIIQLWYESWSPWRCTRHVVRQGISQSQPVVFSEKRFTLHLHQYTTVHVSDHVAKQTTTWYQTAIALPRGLVLVHLIGSKWCRMLSIHRDRKIVYVWFPAWSLDQLYRYMTVCTVSEIVVCSDWWSWLSLSFWPLSLPDLVSASPGPVVIVMTYDRWVNASWRHHRYNNRLALFIDVRSGQPTSGRRRAQGVESSSSAGQRAILSR